MSPLNQIGGLFAHLRGQGSHKPLSSMADPPHDSVPRSRRPLRFAGSGTNRVYAPVAGPFETLSDAEAYGVTLQPASVAPGQWYWQAVRTHHLTPGENAGNHHLHVSLVQRITGSDGGASDRQVEGARARITWQSGEEILALDKAAGERGASFAMLQKLEYGVEALGLPGEELPSDRVTGLHTALPDEPPGNSLFHHSFSVTFCMAQAPAEAAAQSAIQGLIHGATGQTVLLLRNDEIVGRQPVGDDEMFRFAGLSGDVYVVALESTPLRSGPVTVTGNNQARLELSVAPGGSTVAGQVRNGTGRTLILECAGAQVASQVIGDEQTYRFTGLAAGDYRLGVAGTPVRSESLALNGSNTLSADLAAPALAKPLAHYVLFGPAAEPGTHANLLLAQDFLLAFGPAFGFSADEAASAGIVTIIAGTAQVSQAVQDRLAAGGCVVQRIAGTAAEVAAALAARVAAGQPLA